MPDPDISSMSAMDLINLLAYAGAPPDDPEFDGARMSAPALESLFPGFFGLRKEESDATQDELGPPETADGPPAA